MSSRSARGAASVAAGSAGTAGGSTRHAERIEHGQRLTEHRHVLARLLLERLKRLTRRLAEGSALERLRDLIAELLLISGQTVDAELEIARHQHLHQSP